MTCAEFKEQVGALAIGALEPSERAAAFAHLALQAGHEGCVEALRQAEAAAVLLAAELPEVAPSAGVWRAVEGKLTPPAEAQPRPSERPRRWVGGWMVAGAAVAAIAVLWLADRTALQTAATERAAKLLALQGQLAGAQSAAATCRQSLEAVRRDLEARSEALAMLQQSSTAVIALAPLGGVPMRASALYDRSSRHAMVVASGLSAHPGKDFELWVIRGGQKLPAGLLHGDEAGTTVAHVDPVLFADGAPDAFAVTLEPQGGGPAPRGPILLVGTLPKS